MTEIAEKGSRKNMKRKNKKKIKIKIKKFRERAA